MHDSFFFFFFLFAITAYIARTRRCLRRACDLQRSIFRRFRGARARPPRAELKRNKLRSATCAYLIFALNYSISRNARVEYQERGGISWPRGGWGEQGDAGLRCDIANGSPRYVMQGAHGSLTYRVSDGRKRKNAAYYSIRFSARTSFPLSCARRRRREGGGKGVSRFARGASDLAL